MNTQDIWFEPGMKVIRVAGNEVTTPMKKAKEHHLTVSTLAPSPPQYGTVYCVKECWAGPVYNAVIFVGEDWYYENGVRGGWPAAAFRKVEEIQLCVRAAEKFKQNEEVEV